MIRLKETDWWYRKLKQKFPEYTEFWSKYYEGGYYDKSYTQYYGGKNGKVEPIDVEEHGSYG